MHAESLSILASLGSDTAPVVQSIMRKEQTARKTSLLQRKAMLVTLGVISVWSCVSHGMLMMTDLAGILGLVVVILFVLGLWLSGYFHKATDVHKSLAFAISDTEDVFVAPFLIELSTMAGIGADCDRAIARLLPKIEPGSNAELSNRMLEKLSPKLETGNYSLRVAILEYLRDHPNPHPPHAILKAVYGLKEGTAGHAASADVWRAANECWEGLKANYQRGKESSRLLRPAVGDADGLLRAAGATLEAEEATLLRPRDGA